MVVGPREADEAAAGAVPEGGGDGDAGGVEDEELAASGLGVELDDLGVVSNGGDRTAEGSAGDAVAGEVHARAPLEGVELGLAVVAIEEELPLRRHGDCRHDCLRRWRLETLDLDLLEVQFRGYAKMRERRVENFEKRKGKIY